MASSTDPSKDIKSKVALPATETTTISLNNEYPTGIAQIDRQSNANSCSVVIIQFDQSSLDEFERQDLVYLKGIVP
jgi:hypothetical protein